MYVLPLKEMGAFLSLRICRSTILHYTVICSSFVNACELRIDIMLIETIIQTTKIKLREMCCFIYSNHDTLTGGKLIFIHKNPTGENACFVYIQRHNNLTGLIGETHIMGEQASLIVQPPRFLVTSAWLGGSTCAHQIVAFCFSMMGAWLKTQKPSAGSYRRWSKSSVMCISASHWTR